MQGKLAFLMDLPCPGHQHAEQRGSWHLVEQQDAMALNGLQLCYISGIGLNSCESWVTSGRVMVQVQLLVPQRKLLKLKYDGTIQVSHQRRRGMP
jgi:hypothetical protein